MSVEKAIVNRVSQLIRDGDRLGRGNAYGQVLNDQHMQECVGWLAASLNAVQILCPNPENAYRKLAERVGAQPAGYAVQKHVAELTSALKNMLVDLDAGLMASVTDHARAETFDDFLDHGLAYLKDSRKQEAGVIAGVVFEDTLRQIARKRGLDEKGVSIDEIISHMAKIDVLSGVKAKRARAAAHVRAKATHAQWDEFELDDVSAAISFTKELISSEIES